MQPDDRPFQYELRHVHWLTLAVALFCGWLTGLVREGQRREAGRVMQPPAAYDDLDEEEIERHEKWPQWE